MLDRLNSTRGKRGRAALRYSGVVSRGARSYARRMMRRGLWRHATRKSAPGYRRVSEVIGMQYGSRPAPSEIVRWWLRSRVHRPIVLGRSRFAGIGMATGRCRGRQAGIWVVRLADR
jgi:uncharacterized protein YkwD